MKPPRYYKSTSNLDGYRKWKRWVESEFEKLKADESYESPDPDTNIILKDALEFWKEREIERYRAKSND